MCISWFLLLITLSKSGGGKPPFLTLRVFTRPFLIGIAIKPVARKLTLITSQVRKGGLPPLSFPGL